MAVSRLYHFGTEKEKEINKKVSYHCCSIPVRAHTVFWGTGVDPDWVLELQGQELMEEVDRRMEGVVEQFKGRYVQKSGETELRAGESEEERKIKKT